jgi:hypothetical protein
MQELRPFAGAAFVIWVIFRDIGITAGFSCLLFFAGKSQSDTAPVIASFVVAAAGCMVFSRSIGRCVPITLRNDGSIHGLLGSLQQSECKRVVIRRDGRCRFSTVLETPKRKVRIAWHMSHC